MSKKLSSSNAPLFQEIRQLIDSAKQRAATTLNAELTLLYWQVGHRIQTEILQGQRADYGKQILSTLSQQLTQTYGRGWSENSYGTAFVLRKLFQIRRLSPHCGDN